MRPDIDHWTAGVARGKRKSEAPGPTSGQAVGVPETAVPPEAETCAECGFDARRWTVHDADSLMSGLGLWWELATVGGSAEQLNRRPAEGVWSPLEREAVVADLTREGQALAGLARRAPAASWSHRGRLGPVELEGRRLLFHAVHDASHHLLDAGRGLSRLGVGMGRAAGRVEQINASAGGVPKLAKPAAEVGWDGVAGDRQRSRRHHGRPFQALCLWSSEVIAALAAEGHPIAPGFAGENLTLSGLDWSAMRPGTRLHIGSVVAEVSFPATPCTHQRPWFSDGDYTRIDHGVNPGIPRWYAWVREPGRIEVGDRVLTGV